MQKNASKPLTDTPAGASTPAAGDAPAQSSIEDKIKQLNASVEWFYGDDFSLDAALEKYRAADELAKSIEKDLAELKNRVEVIADFAR